MRSSVFVQPAPLPANNLCSRCSCVKKPVKWRYVRRRREGQAAAGWTRTAGRKASQGDVSLC